MSESFFWTVLSLIAAVVLARLFLPYFAAIAGKNISPDSFRTFDLSAGLIAILVFVGLVAGGYPALFLSAFKPIAAWRGSAPNGSKGSLFRPVLVVFQFAVSIILIISTISILDQHRYMQNKDLGFNKKNVLAIAIQNDEVRTGLESYKQELLNIAGVESAGASSMVPGEIYLFNTGARPEGFPKDHAARMDHFLVDDGFLDTLGIAVVKGRQFSKDMTADFEESIMINETAAKSMGWDDPVGKTIEVDSGDHPVRKTVIGVFGDIHQRSL